MAKIVEGTMPYLGYETYYRIVGEANPKKAPLLLLHGGPGSTHNYFEILDDLADRDDRQIIMYDQIGCGNSYVDGHPELWTKETWTRYTFLDSPGAVCLPLSMVVTTHRKALSP